MSSLRSNKRRIVVVVFAALFVWAVADLGSVASASEALSEQSAQQAIGVADESSYAATSAQSRLWVALVTGLLIIVGLVIGLVVAHAKDQSDQARKPVRVEKVPGWVREVNARFAVSGLAKRAPELTSVFRR